MFNNTNPETNGERRFFNSIKENCTLIFDVGASDDFSDHWSFCNIMCVNSKK
jgi:hypothetical protein